MSTSNILFKKYITELESSFILLIERELDIFFSACIKSAKVYSIMISNNLSLHDEKTFEELVLSPMEINTLIENVVSKINIELRKNLNYSHLDVVSTPLIENNYYNHSLDDTTESLRAIQLTTKICENIINSALSYVLGRVWPNKLIKKSFKKIISGKKILDNHNLKNQTKKYQEYIYAQLEGFLINTKVSLRNDLISSFIMCLNNTKNIYESA